MNLYLRSLLVLFLFFNIANTSFAQSDNSDAPEMRNELKLNTFYMVLGAAEINYERVINEESSFGIAGTFVFEEDSFWKWGITPYYRIFFSQGHARGFFVEGHASVFGYEDFRWIWDQNGVTSFTEDEGTSAGLGVSIGYKVLTSRNLVAEVYGGVGRIFKEINFDSIYPRFGISVGKRF